MKIRHLALAVPLAASLAITACGSGDDAAPSTAPSSTTSTTTSVTPTSTTPQTVDDTPAPVVEEPAADGPDQTSIWAPPGQGINCPGTDAYVWDYADCNPSNGVINPDDYYHLLDRQLEDNAHRAEVDAYNAEVDAHDQRVQEYDAAWVECLGDVNRPDYYEREDYCEVTIPKP